MNSPTTHYAAPVSCSKCGYVMDCATSARDDGAIAGPGDVTLCLKCGKVFVFGPTMELVDAPAHVLNDPEVKRVQRAIWELL